jgi:hypothetical protein
MTKQQTVEQKKNSQNLRGRLYNIRENIAKNEQIITEMTQEEYECRPTEEELMQEKRDNWLRNLCPIAQTARKK